MKTRYCTAASLDGFIATEDDSLAWLFALGSIDDSRYPQCMTGVPRRTFARQPGAGMAELRHDADKPAGGERDA